MNMHIEILFDASIVPIILRVKLHRFNRINTCSYHSSKIHLLLVIKCNYYLYYVERELPTT